jgi:two-component system sensor histidine kinase/response regulator
MVDYTATVLVVDDDPTILDSIADVLRVSGYNCLTAANGIEALQVMQQHAPNLIVADIMMPKMDGYQFYEAVRQNAAWVSIPFIFLSAKGEQHDIRYGYDMGADHYLTKPFESEDLLVAIRSRLRRISDIQAAAQTEVEETKQQLLNIFGHELRTPLTYIYGYLSLLHEGEGRLGEEAKDEILQAMHQGVDRMVKLVEDLLLIVYIDSGAAEVEMSRYSQHVDLNLEIQQAVREHHKKAEARDIGISMVVPYDLVVRGVPAYTQDIFARLIDNAIKFGKPEGRVWIRAEASGGFVKVSVRDDGVGIPPDKQKVIFERFHQIDRDRMEQQGVGLGLAIAERLVQLHDGDIRVESQPGQGSTFTVRLPVFEQNDTPLLNRGD